MAINSVRTSLRANSSKSTPRPILPNSIPTAMITTPETTAGKNLRNLLTSPPNQRLASTSENHHAADDGESKMGRRRDTRREINGGNHRRTQIPGTDSPDAKTLEHGEEAHRNHRPRHRISRLCMWKFRRTGHQRHHHQVRTDDRHVLETQRQQLQWWRLFIERVNEIFGALRHAGKMRSEIGLSQPKDKSNRRAQISQSRIRRGKRLQFESDCEG